MRRPRHTPPVSVRLLAPLMLPLALACGAESTPGATSGFTEDSAGETTTAAASTTGPTTADEPGTATSAATTTATSAATTTAGTTEAATTEPATTGDACVVEAADACGECMRDACCEAVADCQADASCLACVLDEDPDACESSPETHARVDAFLACKGGACQAACIGGPVGSCEDALAELAEDACTTCLGDACCDALAACHGNEVCWSGCFVVHDDAVCHSDPDGHALYHALGACASASCQAECL